MSLRILYDTPRPWLMQRGAPMWEAASFLSISEKTLRDTYGHHHPAHLRGAADAIASRPSPKKRWLFRWLRKKLGGK